MNYQIKKKNRIIVKYVSIVAYEELEVFIYTIQCKLWGANTIESTEMSLFLKRC